MKTRFILLLGFITMVSLANCGGSDSADDGDDGGATPTTSDAQASANAGSALVRSMQSSTDNGVVASASAAALVKEAIKNKFAVRTAYEMDETWVFDCGNEGTGTMAVDMTGSLDIDDSGESASIDITVAIAFDQCENTYDYYTADEVLCVNVSEMDGDFDCDMTGSYTADDLSFSFLCNTSSACSGLTMTFNGVDYTVGFTDLGAIMTSAYDEPTLTGTVCVDGTEYDFEDIEALMETYESTELVCE